MLLHLYNQVSVWLNLHGCVSVPTIDSTPTLVPWSKIILFIIFLHISSSNLGWWVSATLFNSWWMYCCPDGAPDSANPTNRYDINCCKTGQERAIQSVYEG